MGNYLPLTESDREEMLKTIGVQTEKDLFNDIPEKVRLDGLNLPDGMSEMEMAARIREMAAKNKIFGTIFRGAGAYRHYVPAIVKSVVSKEEFVTAYTPYQAEISQGILQSIFEYQTMICALTGMDVSNASVYDGACAAAEALNMCRDRKHNKALIASGIHPEVKKTIGTYTHGNGMQVEVLPAAGGITALDALEKALQEDGVACVCVQQPNYYGLLEPAEEIGALCKKYGVKYIMSVNPISLGLLKTPAECGADIAVGEGQPLGMELAFGGPYLGFMAATRKLMRSLPGRIVGETVDTEGRRAYVLTLQAREQHIRREKASSNICSNEALCALTASVYLAAVGPEGLYRAASSCCSKAHYFAGKLEEIGYKRVYQGEFFHEFVTTAPDGAETAVERLEKNNILGGLPLPDGNLLWCCTEMNTKSEMDRAVAILKRGEEAKDMEDGAKIIDALPELDFLMCCGLMYDYPVTSYEHQYAVMLRNSTKPQVVTAADRTSIDNITKMAVAVRGSLEELARKPLFIMYNEPTSPLNHTETAVDKLIYCSENQLPTNYSPCMMPGATGPITNAGAIVQGNAECLAGLVIHQLAHPGSPIVFGGAMYNMDLKCMQPTYCSPESIVNNISLAQIGRELYELPTWGFTACSGGKVFDAQAMNEAAQYVYSVGFAGVNLNHDVGFMNYGLTFSYELLVASNETISQMRRVFDGVQFDKDHLAMDVMKSVGPKGHYLSEEHTLKYNKEMWQPDLTDRSDLDGWKRAGSTTFEQRVKERTIDIIENYVPKPLTPEQDAKVEEILKAADEAAAKK